jgi:hypothetical protein
MHIIFGDAINEIPDSFTILELDTFKLNDTEVKTAYCVVEKIPLVEFTTLQSYKNLHADLIRYYREKKWNFCEQAIESLLGKWNGELDTFYLSLNERICQYKIDDSNHNNGVIEKC